MTTKIEPRVTANDLPLGTCRDIIRRVQEALWWNESAEGDEWLLPENTEYDITKEVAELFTEYDLQPVEIEDEPEEPTEPEEGDLITKDHRKFWEYGMNRRKPVVVVPEGEDWEPYVDSWLTEAEFYPNVWFESDHGNLSILNMVEYYQQKAQDEGDA